MRERPRRKEANDGDADAAGDDAAAEDARMKPFRARRERPIQILRAWARGRPTEATRPSPNRPARRRNRVKIVPNADDVRGNPVPAAAGPADLDAEADADPVAAPLGLDTDDADEEIFNDFIAADADADEEEGDTLADWNVPSWNDLIAGLYRPDR